MKFKHLILLTKTTMIILLIINCSYADIWKYEYTFKYQNGDGDYYKGYGFAPKDYFSAEKWIIDENNNPGYYKINYVASGYDDNLNGQVFISTYFDKESNKTFTPLNYQNVAGYSYLGSESGYIISNQDSRYRFGCYNYYGQVYEADLANLWRNNFTFLYANGDYYEGYVYADSDYGYRTGQIVKYALDEHGQAGNYKITGGTDLGYCYYDDSRIGKVYLTKYYDKESNKTFTPLNYKNVAGYSYLGSESGYIISDQDSRYRIGCYNYYGQVYEADLANLWINYFTFTYGNGDFYRGYVYALSDYGYRTGEIAKYTVDENGRIGKYTITGGKDLGYILSYNDSRIGKVYVSSYYDKERNKYFKPLYIGQPVGTDYLGSEVDYIIRPDESEYLFGNGYYEADVPLIINDCKLIAPEDLVRTTGDVGYKYNPNNPNVILVHGWNPASEWTKDKDYLWDWSNEKLKSGNDWYNMATSLYAATGKKVNIFIWDWTNLATASLFSGPPLGNESTSSSYLSTLFQDYLNGVITPQKVQFIGHSMGGKVSLLSAINLDEKGVIDVNQVTLLDPYQCQDTTNAGEYNFIIDHYASLISRIYGYDFSHRNYYSSNNFVDSADVNVNLTDVKLSGFLDISRAHSEAVKYYLTTIKYPNYYGKVGYYWSFINQNGGEIDSQYYLGYKYERKLTKIDKTTYKIQAEKDTKEDFAGLLWPSN